MSTITQNIANLLTHIRQAETAANRKANTVQLLAVSKTKPSSQVAEAYAAGQRHFGENYLQEALEKQQQLSHLSDIIWHYIGPIQSNKTRPIAEHFHWVHSVDRLKIAQRLDEQRPVDMPQLNICIQVNISRESTKSGVFVEELGALVQQIIPLKRLALRGIMAIPESTDNSDDQLTTFLAVKEALQGVESPPECFDTLSMGMSNDMETAIRAGSTFVRIGTAIFGKRSA